MLFGPDPECTVAPGGAVIFYDIGCGDGRVLCTAACVPNVMRAVGVEFDAELASRARKAAEALRIDRQGMSWGTFTITYMYYMHTFTTKFHTCIIIYVYYHIVYVHTLTAQSSYMYTYIFVCNGYYT